MVFSIVKDNPPIDGFTISYKGDKSGRVYFFSLGNDGDISKENYDENKLITLLSGEITIYSSLSNVVVKEGEAVITIPGSFGVKADKESVYMEVGLGREIMVNEKIKAGDVFSLKDLVPYRAESIVNMDVLSSSTTKFALMAFDKGTALSEHSAPGDAIVFALEGSATIGYEGKEYKIKEGENFRFEKNGRHSVKADERFKMALLLSLE